MIRPQQRIGVVLIILAVLLGSMLAPSLAQLGGRHATTLDALSKHPLFFHGEQVIIHADVIGDGPLAYLVGDTNRLLLLDVTPPPEGLREHMEVVGVFYDVGRLEPDDPRAAGQPFERLSQSLLNRPWPGVGQLSVLIGESTRATTESTDVTLRTLVLAPSKFVAQGVTVTGRFRGRNLYGDLPESPSESRYDFVLVSAEAAVWIVGREPKGDGFDLDVQARTDTGRWLDVTGEVRLVNGMVLIEPGSITLADPPDRLVRPDTPVEVRRLPQPEVIFSAPLDGDVDVPPDTTVRIQFSRDMTENSFTGQINVYYANEASTDVEQMALTDFEVEYLGRNRVLQIRFVEELDPYRTLSVDLLDGITASDGVPIKPWTLSFFVGG